MLCYLPLWTMAQIQWPAGKKAAIMLTYDDGLQSQLDNVVRIPCTLFAPMVVKCGYKANWAKVVPLAFHCPKHEKLFTYHFLSSYG